MANTKFKYIVVGGNPFLVHTKGLRVLGLAKDKMHVNQIIEDNYYDCVGLIIVLDADTGQRAEGLDNKYEFFELASSSPGDFPSHNGSNTINTTGI